MQGFSNLQTGVHVLPGIHFDFSKITLHSELKLKEGCVDSKLRRSFLFSTSSIEFGDKIPSKLLGGLFFLVFKRSFGFIEQVF